MHKQQEPSRRCFVCEKVAPPYGFWALPKHISENLKQKSEMSQTEMEKHVVFFFDKWPEYYRKVGDKIVEFCSCACGLKYCQQNSICS
jgi:hypothetical protein